MPNQSHSYEPLTSENAAVILVDHQVGLMTGVRDPILWGSVAFLLNYIPILGPLSGVAILFLAGLLSFDTIWQALLPAGLYLAFHIIEGEYVTPMLLARRFTLNPVLVIICLGVLVLDVGYRWSDPDGTHACHAENHLRPHSAADGVGPFYWR